MTIKKSAAKQAMEDMKLSEEKLTKAQMQDLEALPGGLTEEMHEAFDKGLATKAESMKPLKKTEDERIADAVAKAIAALPKNDMAAVLKEILPTVILAMESAKNMSGHDQNLKLLKAKLALEEKCSICRQVVGDGKTRGCGGPWARDDKGEFLLDPKTGARIEAPEQFHDKMCVFPNDPIAERQWDGVKINGAVYVSQGLGHKVWVPRKNDIASQILKFEEDQRIQQVGRKHMRKSGSLSGNGGTQVQNPTFS